ncbi:hypothetical protein [Microlunatus flavus]|uniref:Galactose mutarotase n=1 Tax=Microlunatus flavus TaxID=1036181 RepID=A0A1H9IDD7_9ACTN|nr:hypothetical protein [Microlunatus flavus]SEQ72577.1 hypothetical protein SAMN05421756_105199 [Microlunatus flavus]
MTRPLVLDVDLAHGGRWTSLRTREREWLWTNPDRTVQGARPHVRPGDAFVDAGGVEECFPTLRGTPDHGDVWSRPWSGSPDDATVTVAGARLRRTVRVGNDTDGSVVLGYTVEGEPGAPFVHAVHALLDVGPEARLEVPGAGTMVVLDVDDPVRTWPSGLDRLGPDDGTAVCAVLPGVEEATVTDGAEALRFRWEAPGRAGLCSLVLWRNLRGWPATGPYRSIGLEPTLGRTVDQTGPGAARLDARGRAAWTITVTAL